MATNKAPDPNFSAFGNIIFLIAIIAFRFTVTYLCITRPDCDRQYRIFFTGQFVRRSLIY